MTYDALVKENKQISEKMNKMYKTQKIVRQNIITSWRKKVDHLLDMIKMGNEPREFGICWAIIGLWMIGVPVNLKDFNSQLDIHNRTFLIKKSQ